jgi:hypothetical protein
MPRAAKNEAFAGVSVLLGGIIAGTLDITYAWAYWHIRAGATAQRIFQSVAKGLLGAATFKGGTATAALGIFLHYFIATCMSLAYYFMARRRAALYEQPWTYGPVYGAVLYVVMSFIVVPLSRARGGGSGGALWVTLSIVVHVLLIGLPIALFTRRALT